MQPVSRLRRLRRHAADFVTARRGNIAVIFAIALIPLLLSVGMVADYSRLSMARTAMQTAIDSAALMLSKDLASGTITPSQVSAAAQTYFAAMYSNPDARSVAINVTYTPGGSGAGQTIQLNGSGAIATDFMNLAGYPTMGFNVRSTTTWGTDLLRIALVLDNTSSMNDYNKIGALKTAAKTLVTQFAGLAANNGDVYVSVIPFESDVNVGASNVNAAWLRWDRWDPNEWHYASSQQTWCSDDGWSETLAQCQDHGYSWNHKVGSPGHAQWNGCVTDRDKDYDVSATAPSAGSVSTLFIADQEPFCPETTILPLTYNWSLINSTIDSMYANGSTNQTIGLQWGWFSLLRQDPLNAPQETLGKRYQHIIILFTDGLNTVDRWYGDYDDQSPDVDARMAALCNNIKNDARGFTVYAVQIDTDGAGPSAVLPSCASGSSNFFMLTKPSDIAAAFAKIFTSISRLRVAK
ncbi:MAG TPA: TadE/TadG family type IV pilus assembly protein [Bradyrhizobium sp.]